MPILVGWITRPSYGPPTAVISVRMHAIVHGGADVLRLGESHWLHNFPGWKMWTQCPHRPGGLCTILVVLGDTRTVVFGHPPDMYAHALRSLGQSHVIRIALEHPLGDDL